MTPKYGFKPQGEIFLQEMIQSYLNMSCDFLAWSQIPLFWDVLHARCSMMENYVWFTPMFLWNQYIQEFYKTLKNVYRKCFLQRKNHVLYKPDSIRMQKCWKTMDISITFLFFIRFKTAGVTHSPKLNLQAICLSIHDSNSPSLLLRSIIFIRRQTFP